MQVRTIARQVKSNSKETRPFKVMFPMVKPTNKGTCLFTIKAMFLQVKSINKGTYLKVNQCQVIKVINLCRIKVMKVMEEVKVGTKGNKVNPRGIILKPCQRI
jgi:hypothetical protein